jgi:imidazolonepropionase-like amidohydrolase
MKVKRITKYQKDKKETDDENLSINQAFADLDTLPADALRADGRQGEFLRDHQFRRNADMKRFLVLALLLLLQTTLLAQEKQEVYQRTLAFTHVTVIDATGAPMKRDMTVVITGDRITLVGETGRIRLPEGAQVVDSTSKFLIPGLIDMHTHGVAQMNLPLALYIANGVTTIRDTGGDVTLLRLTREQISLGKRFGPRLFFAGQIIDGNPPVWPDGSILADSLERAESAVNFLVDQGVDFIKTYNNITEPVLKTIIHTAHRRGIPVIGHVPRSITMTRAVELGVDGLEHVRITGREMLPLDEANKIDFLPYARREILLWQQFDLESQRMRKLVSLLAQKKVFLNPTLVVEEDTFVIPLEDKIKHANNRFLPTKLFEEWSTAPISDVFKIPPELRAAALSGFDKRKRFVGMCNRAGVRIIAGSDGIGPGNLLPGFGLHRELELLVESGLSPMQALQTATINAAQALRKDKELGTIEAGKLADLIILEADPLKDISNTRKISAVVANGRLLDGKALNDKLDQAEAAARRK